MWISTGDSVSVSPWPTTDMNTLMRSFMMTPPGAASNSFYPFAACSADHRSRPQEFGRSGWTRVTASGVTGEETGRPTTDGRGSLVGDHDHPAGAVKVGVAAQAAVGGMTAGPESL